MNKQSCFKAIIDMKKYVFLYFSFLIYSGTSICAKNAAMHPVLSKDFLLFAGMEIVLLAIYAIVWQQVLKHFSLVRAMASKGIVIIFNLLWSYLLFHEKISIYNIIGAATIILGIWVVSKDD